MHAERKLPTRIALLDPFVTRQGRRRVDSANQRALNPERIGVRILSALLLMITLAGCSTRVWNQPVSKTPAALSYDFTRGLPRTNAQDVFVIVAFSGGGTRSAAFSYGVLEALRDTQVTIHGQDHRLLDEIDVITSVSGGSYTAAYYGLFGDQIFSDFESKFLKRDVQGSLKWLLANPVTLAGMASKRVNRGDMAAHWLNRNVFQGREFSDMSRGDLPFVILNASDINTGIAFPFIQQQFDFLCSDINSYPVAHAVLASSAAPVVFGPIPLRNFDTHCAGRTGSWVQDGLSSNSLSRRDTQVAQGLVKYFTPETLPVIRLVDGGVTDNLGLRGSIMSPVAHYGNVADMAGAFTPEALDAVTNVLVIIADAQVEDTYDWSRNGREPGIFATLQASFFTALHLLSTETKPMARSNFMMWADRINARRPLGMPKVVVRVATLDFESIEDERERAYFNAIPTALSLTDEQVDRLRTLAGDLLDASYEFQTFTETLP